MKFTAGETVTIAVGDAVLVVKVEDASKGDTLSARVEEVHSGSGYTVGQICDFDRSNIQEA